MDSREPGGLRPRPEAPRAGAAVGASSIALDESGGAAITKFEQAQARRNAASKEIGEAKEKKDEAAAQKLMAEVAELKTTHAGAGGRAEEIRRRARQGTGANPQPAARRRAGRRGRAAAMSSITSFGKKRDYAFTPKQHFELGEALGMMDFELAAKLSGARFVVLQKGLARMERALGQFILDVHTSEKHGYTEVNPPLLVRDEVMFGTAQLPKFAEDQFSTYCERIDRLRAADRLTRIRFARIEANATYEAEAVSREHSNRKADSMAMRSNFEISSRVNSATFWLIPTAEVPLTNLVRESIVDEDTLPRALDRLHAVLPRRSGRRRQGHARHDPPAPVHQSRTGLHHHAGKIQRRARAHAGLRRGSAEEARPALPRGHAVHRRHGLCRAEDLRHRGLAAGAGHVSRDFVLLELRRVPGAAHERALQAARTARSTATCTRSTAPASPSAAR